MTYTIFNALIPVETGYTSVDIQIEGDHIAAIAPNLPITGTPIDATNRRYYPALSMVTPTLPGVAEFGYEIGAVCSKLRFDSYCFSATPTHSPQFWQQ